VPIESVQLDDLRFATVVDQLRRQIPAYTPEWTDHNESDPGITLLQLFGYLTEQIGYRLNRLPDKAYVEMLKLVGIRLRPAEAATTTLAFYLAKAELATGFAIPEGARVRARTKANPPPTFETTRAIDAVPAQLVTVVTTSSDDLRDLAPGVTFPATATPAGELPPRFSLAWDGRAPKLKDWPEQPVRLFARPSEAAHVNVWLGLACNPLPSAGFLGQRVTLTVQLDDDEQPDAQALADCSDDLALLAEQLAPGVELVWYQPAQPGQATGSWQPLRVLSDSSNGLTRSGQIRFDVPLTLGPVPDAEWNGLALTPAIPHPLVGAIKTPVQGAPAKVPVSGWIGLRFAAPPARLALRALTFNAAPAIAAVTAANELVSRGTQRSDQVVQLAFGNVLADSLELVVQDVPRAEYQRWTRVDDLDTAGPDDRIYVLDAEAGLVYFGDGVHGRVPGLDARIVAVRYRHGGGAASEVGVGLVTQGENLPVAIQDVTNPVAARGGRDAETLDQARRRAPRALKTLDRAVTADDYELLAGQTPGVRVARSIVIPLRRPYAAEGLARPGIDVTRTAPGALSIVVVPEGSAAFLAPTEGMLRTVCKHLDRYRLITTELYVVAPQYVRIFDLTVTVLPRPGFTRTQLREAIALQLERYLHVLTGGPDGAGYPFGGTLYHAELVAQVFRVDGVDRVEALSARYDGTAPDATPAMQWRDERRAARNLVACPTSALDDERVALFPDETVFIDTANLTVIVPV
jgi:predicted phage baseplate assembly protein